MSREKPTKILRIQSRICIGGPSIHTELLSKYMPKTDYSTLLIGGAVDEGEVSRIDDLTSQGLRVMCVSEMRREVNLLHDLKALVAVYRIIRREKPIIVCTHTSKAGAIGRSAAILAGVPLIFHTFHGHAFSGYFSRPVTFVYLMIERILARFTDRVIAISPEQLRDLAFKYHVAPASRFAVVRLGFELDKFINIPRTTEFKKRLGLDEDCFLIGAIARLVPIKNLAASLRILKALAAKDNRFHLCIVGDGPERATLEEFCRRMDIQQRVHFVGWMKNVCEVYSGIDLLLLTSLNEGTPVTIIEAMAAGVPVAASRVGGVPDLIQEGQTGFTFAVNDDEAAAACIERIANEPELRAQITKQARSFAVQNYHYSRMIREMDALYKHFLRKRM